MNARKPRLDIVLAVAMVMMAAPIVDGQESPQTTSSFAARYAVPAGSFIPMPGYGFSRHSSTAQEGMARGMADVIRSRGQANLNNAQAATQMEVARRAYLENRTYAAESYLERRRIQKDYGEEVRAEKRASLAEHVKRRELQPLTSSEFYAPTGKITWPIVLMHPNFEKGRKMVEDLFAKRAETAVMSAEDNYKLYQLLKTWEGHIPSYKDQFPASEIQAAVRFLRRLQKIALQNEQ